MKISVIIPTLNEVRRISMVVGCLRREDPSVEIIVVDGGSSDRTPEHARAAGATVLSTAPSRGGQLSLGADGASGMSWFSFTRTPVFPAAA